MKKYGFDSLSVTEPLLGVIDKATSKKMVVFDFIKGDSLETVWSWLVKPSLFTIRRDRYAPAFVGDLQRLFKDRGVSSVDLQPRHILLDTNGNKRNLFLIDMEGYRQIK